MTDTYTVNDLRADDLFRAVRLDNVQLDAQDMVAAYYVASELLTNGTLTLMTEVELSSAFGDVQLSAMGYRMYLDASGDLQWISVILYMDPHEPEFYASIGRRTTRWLPDSKLCDLGNSSLVQLLIFRARNPDISSDNPITPRLFLTRIIKNLG